MPKKYQNILAAADKRIEELEKQNAALQKRNTELLLQNRELKGMGDE